MLSLLFALQQTALAIPTQMTQQGRLIDSSGAALSSIETVTFSIFDDPNNGTVLWTETLSVSFNNGYYATVLGSDEQNNPLDSLVLSQYPLYLEIQIGSASPLSPRYTLQSVPYAQISGSAESVDGGSVVASDISIGSQPVINSSGEWVGPTISIGWNDIDQTTIPGDIADGDNDTQLSETTVENYITNSPIDLSAGSQVQGALILTQGSTISWSQLDASTIPSDLADGDDDTLGGLSCSVGEVLGWSGTWTCVSDNTLSATEVGSMISSNAYDLNVGTTIGGLDIVTSMDDSDTLADLNCANDAEVAKYDIVTNTWYCDSDTVRTDSDIVTAVESSSGVNLPAGTQVDGNTIITAPPTCSDGQILSYDATNAVWQCIDLLSILDQDGDGVLAWNDCDDSDPNASSPLSGASASCAATNCLEILNFDASSPTGDYWINPDDGTPYEAYCDMTTDGGGWTLLGTVYGGDGHNWNTQNGYWSDGNTLGDITAPFEDYKSEAWIDYDITDAEVMLERRYNNTIKSKAKLNNACLHNKTYFTQLFTTWDTNLRCGLGNITILQAATNTDGLSSSVYREGNGSSGLGGSSTNGWCWNGGDNQTNTFKGHAGWNQSSYGCYGSGHLGYVGVFVNGDTQYDNHDITGTNWLYGTTYASTAYSFYVR